METEAEIRAEYMTLHDSLSYQYYQLQEMTKEEFDAVHGQCWSDMKVELIACGYLPNPIPRASPFEPLNPTMSIPQRVSHIEEFLRGK